MKKLLYSVALFSLIGFQGCLSDNSELFAMPQDEDPIIVVHEDSENVENTTEECSDTIDNDNDDDIDCDDSNCKELLICSVTDSLSKIEDTAEKCSDGIDNDESGIQDCAEVTCAKLEVCLVPEEVEMGIENTEKLCSDQVDNDGDQLPDCLDPECQNFKICLSGGGSTAEPYFPSNVILAELPGIVELEDFIDSATSIAYNWNYNDINSHICYDDDARCNALEAFEDDDDNFLINMAGWNDAGGDSLVDRRAGLDQQFKVDQKQTEYYRADEVSDVEIVEAWDTEIPEAGNGLNYGLGNMHESEQLSYAVKFNKVGTYSVRLRAASDFDNKSVAPYIISFRVAKPNDPNATLTTFDFAIPHTGSWWEYVDVYDTITVEAGLAVVEMNVTSGAYNVNFLEFDFIGE